VRGEAEIFDRLLTRRGNLVTPILDTGDGSVTDAI
jgi:hypothetical protein